MKFIQPDHWQPKGIDDLEPNAWQALRRRESTSVIAGPGAGKTEFLAQKAAYLLETGLCPPNKKILAISFKTDAAKNLADRVKERCPEELSNRFVSMTFDAFTKNLVDRFRMALPERHRPSKRYEIAFPSSRQEKQLISRFKNSFDHVQMGIYDFTKRLQNMNQFIGSVRIGDPKLSWLEEEFLTFWLSQQVNYADGISRVSFPALNRLAEYIVRTNDHVRRSIRASYPIVFVDEFQDTTFAQYDFLSSVFKSSEAEVTAVGDYKQRIMGWAGAKGNAFHQFEADFSAHRHSLLLNHRSSPELVRIQHVIAQAIDHEVREVYPSNNNLVAGDAAWICCSYNVNQEAAHLAQWIANDMQGRSLNPRSYSILVRQKPEDYVQPISHYLAQHGLSLRNESVKVGQTTLQDLLAEELTILFSTLLRLGLGRRNAQAWNQLSSDMQILRNTNQEDEKALRQVERQLTKFISTLRMLMQQPLTRENGRDVFERTIKFINSDDLRSSFSRYATGDLLEINLAALEEFFTNCVDTQSSWEGLLNEFEGTNHIPLMTIHKSKGLEFDTTIFMGIDDNAWWSYKQGDAEGLSTFFVALSRAKQRAIFSYCQQRGQRTKVADFYALLTTAGVQEYVIPPS
ncbi:ATP-dependent helicase [Vibrio parahaemolyticus]|uniref:UvrD-helicase domain-containing protein n=1 Tax=Vibrio parahaemolyticus TaxID=670 RepID=UPI0024AFEA78|nr:ATP-dependent helicase [Vibrio parahaemolyticus]MDI7833653.1 ATP-dependent helicase [Vibrio parahaemolyticus]HCM1376706.1 ATP-dependent helicase [Vibrio parahaemolyticus]